MKNIKYIVFSIVAMYFVSCKEEESNEVTLSDTTLYKEAIENSGFTYFQSGFLKSTKTSGHGANNYVKTRYNNLVKNLLNEDGKPSEGTVFPDGSIIVKEIYSDTTKAPDVLAVMKKDSKNSGNDSKWHWAEYEPDGKVYYALKNNGSGCISCHSVNSDDYVVTFRAIP